MTSAEPRIAGYVITDGDAIFTQLKDDEPAARAHATDLVQQGRMTPGQTEVIPAWITIKGDMEGGYVESWEPRDVT